MTLNGWLQIALFIAAVLLLAKPMGSYMTRVFERRKTFLDPLLVPANDCSIASPASTPTRRCAGPSTPWPC